MYSYFMGCEINQDYEKYLNEHTENVLKGLNWLKRKGIIDETELSAQEVQVIAKEHDLSKRSIEEYPAYADYFYGKDGKDEDDISVIDSAFDYAWLHHIHHNPHHWQYWVLVGDDDGIKALEMPTRFVYEMIADWWTFSWKSGNLKEIFKWYDDHKEKMQLHEKTRQLVEKILDEMKTLLEKEDKT